MDWDTTAPDDDDDDDRKPPAPTNDDDRKPPAPDGDDDEDCFTIKLARRDSITISVIPLPGMDHLRLRTTCTFGWIMDQR